MEITPLSNGHSNQLEHEKSPHSLHFFILCMIKIQTVQGDPYKWVH